VAGDPEAAGRTQALLAGLARETAD